MSTQTLVIAEHDHKTLYSGVLNTVTAALAIKSDAHILIAGSEGVRPLAEQAAKIKGISKVLLAEHAQYAHPITESIAVLIVAAIKAGNYTHILAPASTFGKSLIPYIGGLCDTQPISDISEITSADTFIRPIYAGNALATVKTSDPLKLLTIRTTAFDPAPETGGNGEITTIDAPAADAQVEFVEQALSSSERPELTSARVVVSGGRGMQNGENFAMLEKLADKLGGAVGASRAAVDAGFVPNDYQVGQTGKVVAPDLYLAVGISGAIQHLAGMKDSKCIVAINNDSEAPIFQIADYSWDEDLFTAVPALQAELEK